MADLDEDERAELRRQLTDAFEGADYPVSSPMDLVPALPDGVSTRFEVGEFSMTAMQLNTEIPSGDFPYEDVDTLVDEVMEKLDDHDHI